MMIHSKVKSANQDRSLKGETRPALNIFMAVIGKLSLEFLKLRKYGVVFLLSLFFINGYLMAFDQQGYIKLLEPLADDGNIRNINVTFINFQTLILSFLTCYLYLTWLFTKEYFSHRQLQPLLQWERKKMTYLIISMAWFFVMYLPPVYLDFHTISLLAREDSFYETSEFIFDILAAVSFFYLYIKSSLSCPSVKAKRKRNVFFLLLGLLFFFGAGEEISWGQRIFHFQTPEVLSSNIQHEFNAHNLPLFDFRVPEAGKDIPHMAIKTGWDSYFTIVNLFSAFWVSFCIIIPILYRCHNKIRKFLDKIRLPIVPVWIGMLFIMNYIIYWGLLPYIVPYKIAYPMDELRETGYCFLFFILAVWFVNNSEQKKGEPI